MKDKRPAKTSTEISPSILEKVAKAVRIISTEWEDPWNGTDVLPWRRLRTPYRVFLAEMLLVRTRTDIVARHYEKIYARYPDIHTLAETTEGELAETLKPLGLRKRARYILRAARYVLKNYDGEFPLSLEDLKRIPGMGEYTATAFLVFAYGEKRVPADVNILRFLSRLTGLPMLHSTKGSKTLKALAGRIPEVCPSVSTEKLLDFTVLVCTPRAPGCDDCPVRSLCEFARSMADNREE